MENNKSIGEQLKEMRVASGLTQAELYVKSGISIFVISGLESGRIVDTSTYTIKKLQKTLHSKFEI